jgi:hypothetical protein
MHLTGGSRACRGCWSGAGLTTALWWLVSLLLAAYAAESREFGATYGP